MVVGAGGRGAGCGNVLLTLSSRVVCRGGGGVGERWEVGEVAAATNEPPSSTGGLLDHIMLLPRLFFGYISACFSVCRVFCVTSS